MPGESADPPCPNTPRARPPSRRTGRLEHAASRGARCETPRGRLSAAAADSCRLAPSTEAAVQAAGADRLTARDRKSTRLNSSHGYISYAVFCLKKKKKYKDNL